MGTRGWAATAFPIYTSQRNRMKMIAEKLETTYLLHIESDGPHLKIEGLARAPLAGPGHWQVPCSKIAQPLNSHVTKSRRLNLSMLRNRMRLAAATNSETGLVDIMSSTSVKIKHENKTKKIRILKRRGSDHR